jgi:hypothetical protein
MKRNLVTYPKLYLVFLTTDTLKQPSASVKPEIQALYKEIVCNLSININLLKLQEVFKISTQYLN